MTEKQKKSTAKVGETVEVKEGASVTRPDGSERAVTGGLYVLDEPGTFVVDGDEFQVK
jgi:hypothetical protein